jgi:hypothetical protein
MTPRKKPDAMTHTEYLTLIYRIGLTPCSPKAALYLGLSVRQLHRIYKLECPIPRPVGLLLSLYDKVLTDNKPPTQKEKEAMADPPRDGLYRDHRVWQRSAPRGPSKLIRGWGKHKSRQDVAAQIKHDPGPGRGRL